MEIKSFLKTLSIMHLSLVIGLVIFTLIAIAQGKGFNTNTDQSNTLLYLVPILALIGYFGSKHLFKKMLSDVKESDALVEKLKKFQSASHVKYALIEAPAFFALYVYYDSGNALPLVIAICLLAYLFVQRPTKNRISNRLSLSSEELRTLDGQ